MHDRPEADPLLREMYQPWPPQLLGGTAACLLLTLYPPVTAPFAAEWQAAGRPLDPCTRLIPRWKTAVAGTPAEIGRLRRAAAAAHGRVHGQLPADADASRFGVSYDATDPEAMTSMYVIILHLMLAAQEFLGQRLPDDAARDRYCRLAAGTAGYAFGVQDSVPGTIAGLRQAYEAITAGKLQDTGLGRQLRQAMLASPIAGIPAPELAGCAALLLGRRATALLGPLPAAGQLSPSVLLDKVRAAQPPPARDGHGAARPGARRGRRAALTPAGP